ncbi:prepilin-type N-terminal cleavage/methylation domain-containing protein [Pseudomonas schmalbachii]|uniref:Prepilin-type N-terminal cleavage/methylation domain-containing protein n=1 Tax=Pseudomonas schmalbachii TaxID=2816993 RepID=A0ABS3TMH4_9PSED|nr:prepilin-type N-terminal cleavage/methylation domain-containing protein [Pseudomonas schmalbachii]MBO3274598.1 prepilin-type N-terminal cleavage/methylation domain-containing protein [Pseudomonas schmalbachii]
MPISVTCPGSERQSGFTLLELVVVLALVAALGAIVLPSLLKMQEAWRRHVDLQDIASQLRSLGYRTRLQARETIIGADGALPADMLSLPAGWTLSARQPLVYLANGACLGGEVSLQHEDVVQVMQLMAPLCQPELP